MREMAPYDEVNGWGFSCCACIRASEQCGRVAANGEMCGSLFCAPLLSSLLGRLEASPTPSPSCNPSARSGTCQFVLSLTCTLAL